jgi:aconitate hydratase
MTRGTFANIRLKNLLAPGTEGGVTKHLPDRRSDEHLRRLGEIRRSQGIPLIVLAGKDYGMGSSRDWAAKGVYLLGVKAVIAESFERIHRSNLVGMGVLPLQFKKGQTRASLGLSVTGVFHIEVSDKLQPMQEIKVRATNEAGSPMEFMAVCRIDTPVEIDYYRNGGILHMVLRNMLRKSN